MWVLDHAADIESDLSVFHRVDDPASLPGPKFFSLALRLGAYQGVIAARMAEEQERADQRGGGNGEQARIVPDTDFLAEHADMFTDKT